MLFVLLVAVVAAKSPLDAGAGWAEDVIGWVGDFNHSKALAWSESFGGRTPVVNVSKYYPRVYFFYPDGKLMEDVTSGREDKFPYFYADEEELIASMKRALRQTRESMCHD
ncbi:hypothetical protein FOZ62_012364 [Perkinsus olseni]|uniref:Uncharacterized protein n=1 Tax=Perkinsus olseni TaxID=32597 RepID=A0A7J6TG13_PEROL|nr:hypothetical protein FOZ62_012364 [Perkinsus olseni]